MYIEREIWDFMYLNIYEIFGYTFVLCKTPVLFAFANCNLLKKNTTN